MSRQATPSKGSIRHGFAAVATALAMLLLIAGSARAHDWIQVSCANPNGSAAPSAGWTNFTQGAITIGDGANTQCSPSSPLTAQLGNQQAAANGQAEVLEYQPPAGSILIGGTLDGTFTAYGGHQQAAAAQADVLEPQDVIDQGDSAFLCVDQSGCGSSSAAVNAYTGPIALPSGRGGNLYVSAICTALTGYACDQNVSGDDGTWSQVQIHSADLLLQSGGVPGGSSFSGSILQPRAGGVAHLTFTATDGAGPGIYQVSVAIDGQPVWSGTPNTNDGQCAPVGTDAGTGALMFDAPQPCPATESVDLPVTTTGFQDGRHELTVSVTDAAQDAATVLDETITTSNPQVTPVPHRGLRPIHAEFVISWHWQGHTTELRSVAVRHLPRTGRVAARCLGRGCPKLRVRSVATRRVGSLLRALATRRLRSGDRLLITVTEPHHSAERIQLKIRTGRRPLATLLGAR